MSELNEYDGQDVEQRLVRYLDGELSDREAAELEARVERDDRLRELLRQYAALDGRLAELRDRGAEELDAELQRADIVAALERKVLLEGPSRGSRVIRLKPLAAGLAAAAVIAIATAFVLMLPGARDTTDAPGEPFVRASMLPAGETTATEGFVESHPMPLEHMQVRLSPELRRETGVPSGTVYVSSGAVRRAPGVQEQQYPMEWTLTETY